MKYVENEVRVTRTAAGLIEMSPMTKFWVRGVGAAIWLDGIMANSLPKVGRLTLSVVCNPSGGVDAEYTIVRYSQNDFCLVSIPTGEVYNFDQLARLLPHDGSVALENVSEQMGVVAIAGSKSREVLQPLTDNDLSNDAFPWLSAQMGEVGYARDVHLIRVSYTGELGWDLHHPVAYNRHLVDTLLKAGEPHGMVPFGLKALDSMRLEKSYRALHRGLAQDISPLEAGLERFMKLEKDDFIGRDALRNQAKAGLDRVLVMLHLPSCDTSVIADEGVYSDGVLVGRVTSGGFSYFFNHDFAMALATPDHAEEGSQIHKTGPRRIDNYRKL